MSKETQIVEFSSSARAWYPLDISRELYPWDIHEKFSREKFSKAQLLLRATLKMYF